MAVVLVVLNGDVCSSFGFVYIGRALNVHYSCPWTFKQAAVRPFIVLRELQLQAFGLLGHGPCAPNITIASSSVLKNYTLARHWAGWRL